MGLEVRLPVGLLGVQTYNVIIIYKLAQNFQVPIPAHFLLSRECG